MYNPTVRCIHSSLLLQHGRILVAIGTVINITQTDKGKPCISLYNYLAANNTSYYYPVLNNDDFKSDSIKKTKK